VPITHYPHALVAEFKEYGLELQPAGGVLLETAVAARIDWKTMGNSPGCGTVLALWRTSDWYNYAWAGDGKLQNYIPNWWGRAQEAYSEIDDQPVNPNATRLLDVFTVAEPIDNGRALIAWHVKQELAYGELAFIEAYVVYGGDHSETFAVQRIPIKLVDPKPTAS
jgi:hypothetical protein